MSDDSGWSGHACRRKCSESAWDVALVRYGTLRLVQPAVPLRNEAVCHHL
jgi:hypothetical protein